MKTTRKCEICGQTFKSMTDKQWKHIKYEHDSMCKKHKYLEEKNKNEK